MKQAPHSSGPRSNAYSESKRSNWAEYDPFFAEVRAALKRFDSKLALSPAFPEVLALRVQTVDFMRMSKSGGQPSGNRRAKSNGASDEGGELRCLLLPKRARARAGLRARGR